MPSLIQILEICKSKQSTIDYFQRWNILPKEKLCPNGHPMYLYINEEDYIPVSPGAHIQSVESMWRDAKMQNKKMCGTHRSLINSYLCEFLWRKRHPKDTFEAIMFAIANFWNN